MFKNIIFVTKKNFKGGSMSFTSDEQKRIINKGEGIARKIIIIALIAMLFLVTLVTIAIHANKLSMFIYNTDYLSLTTSAAKESISRFIMITYLLCILIIIPLHEFIHLLSNTRKLNTKKIYVILALPFSINIRCDYWRTKAQTIRSYLSPFLFLSIIFLVLYIVVKNPMIQTIFLMSFLTNMMGSVFDIVNAVWFFVVSPKDSLIYQGFILPINAAQPLTSKPVSS